MTEDEANRIAIKALNYLANDVPQLTRFLDMSGLKPADMRNAANKPGFWVALLGFIQQSDDECLAFAANAGLRPQEIALAALTLDGKTNAPFEA